MSETVERTRISSGPGSATSASRSSAACCFGNQTARARTLRAEVRRANGGALRHLRIRALRDADTGIHHVDVVAHRLDDLHVVLDDQTRDAALAEAGGDALDEPPAFLDCDAGGRLVEE